MVENRLFAFISAATHQKVAKLGRSLSLSVSVLFVDFRRSGRGMRVVGFFGWTRGVFAGRGGFRPLGYEF